MHGRMACLARANIGRGICVRWPSLMRGMRGIEHRDIFHATDHAHGVWQIERRAMQRIGICVIAGNDDVEACKMQIERIEH